MSGTSAAIVSQLKNANMPKHVGIIMDGNGRWARARGKRRTDGHLEGVNALRRTVKIIRDFPVDYLTLFSFSSENWSRPLSEVRFLMNLFQTYVDKDLNQLHKANVRIKVIGNRADLAPLHLKIVDRVEHRTQHNTGLTLVFAFNYSAREEIARAMQRIVKNYPHIKPADITPNLIDAHLDTHQIPDPDLIIRTSGEQRLSNFMLWQAAYAEFVFVKDYWPDFDAQHLKYALDIFSRRQRRFGGVS